MAKFQESVSRNVSNNRSQISIKSVIAIILFFVFVVLVLLCLAGFKKVEKCFDKQSFYVVYVEKTKRKMAPESVDLIKKLGGAGCLMFFKDEYYLVANVYLKEDDADEIAEGLKVHFADAGVVKLSHSDIDKKKAVHIAKNLSVSKFFEKMYKVVEDFEDLQMKYLMGSVQEGEFLTKMLKEKLEFESIVNNFENENDEKLFEDIKTYAKMTVNYFDIFLDDFFQSTKKESLICLLKFNLIKLKVDMFDNLQ